MFAEDGNVLMFIVWLEFKVILKSREIYRPMLKSHRGIRSPNSSYGSGGSRNSKLGWPDPHLFLNCCCSLLLLFRS